MDMYNEDYVTLCGSSGYEKKFYFNEAFQNLPDSIKDELKIMCVLFTEEVSCLMNSVLSTLMSAPRKMISCSMKSAVG